MNMDDLDAMFALEDAALSSASSALQAPTATISDTESTSLPAVAMVEKVVLQVPVARSGADLAKWVPVVHQKVQLGTGRPKLRLICLHCAGMKALLILTYLCGCTHSL